MNLVNKLLENANMFPDKICIIEKNKKITFDELKEASLKISKMLQDKGINKGDYVLILQPMSINLYTSLLGIWSIGAIAMIFDPSAGIKNINAYCEKFKPKAFIGLNKAHLLSFYSSAIKEIPIKITTESNLFMPSLKNADKFSKGNIIDVDEKHPALVTFTSGSTGLPKAAVRTHKFLLTQYETLSQNMDYDMNQIDLGTLAVFTLANLAYGITTVIPDCDLRSVANIRVINVVKQIKKHKILRITASPSFLKAIVRYCIKNNIKLESLTHIYTGGGPVFPTVMDQIKKIMINAKLVAVYGSTEAEPIAEIDWSSVSSEDIVKMSSGKGLIAGKPIDNINCRVIKSKYNEPITPMTREQFDSITLATEVGEIVVSGDHVLKGYFEGVGDSENKFDADGVRWHRTGDLGYFDDDGKLWLMGRANAVINTSSGYVYPFSIECVVNTVFGIERCALVEQKEKKILVVEQQEKLDAEQIKKRLNWLQLDNVCMVKKIPVDKRHNAKIDYNALKKMI